MVRDDILSYREMCDAEKMQTLQRGMNFGMRPGYSVVLMSQRANAPYRDFISTDGLSLEYEGHDLAKNSDSVNPKIIDQPTRLPSGKLTQNGLFISSIEKYKAGLKSPELVKVYEKVFPGTWSFKGFFDLIDYKIVFDGTRNVFRFVLKISDRKENEIDSERVELLHTRIIPSLIKQEVWKRDGGRCVKCGSVKNLHFDHDLPFSKGGTSLTSSNVRLLCAKHNLQKSAKIE